MNLSFLKDADEEGEDVNLTPLIDVVFVVLIMFILVAPLVEIDRIQLAGSGDHKKPDLVSFQEGSEIKIHVYADNTVWFNGLPVSIEELHAHLKDAFRNNPHVKPQVYHDRKAFFETYQSVKNAAEAAGFETLDVILKPG